MSSEDAAPAPLNPPLVVVSETAHPQNRKPFTVHVIRDDTLEGGTKQRALGDFIQHYSNYHEFVYAGPVCGFAQVALAYVTHRLGKKSSLFVSKQRDGTLHPLTRRAQHWGAQIHETKYVSSLKFIQKQAADYVARDPKTRYLLEFGMHDHVFLRALQERLREAALACPSFAPSTTKETVSESAVQNRDDSSEPYNENTPAEDATASTVTESGVKRKHTEEVSGTEREFVVKKRSKSSAQEPLNFPRRLWLVAGSATILAALAKVWPKTVFLVVQVGKTIWDDQRGIEKDGTITFQSSLFVSPEKFYDVAISQPPYPSVSNYDAKLWQFVLEQGEEGDYIWNVGRD